MNGYVPTPADGWAELAEMLTASGRPWPASGPVTDLRWYVDRQGMRLRARGVEHPTHAQLIEGIPGRPTLVKRWNWTDHQVRELLRRPSQWWDTIRWGPSPADRQRVASRSPAVLQPDDGQTVASVEESPADRQRVASRSPAVLHTRGDPPSPTPSPSPFEHTPLPLTGEVCASGEPRGIVERLEAVLGDSVRHVDPAAALAELRADEPVLVEPGWPWGREPSPAAQGDGGAPEWARKAKRPRGVTPLALTGAVSRCLEAIRQRPTIPERAATDAKPLLALWRAQQLPPLDAFVAQVELVADWARRSPDKAAARDIRAEGWEGGTDRRDSVATLCRQDRWGDRLALAEGWDRRGRPTCTGPPGRASPGRGGEWVDTRTAEERERIERERDEAWERRDEPY